eukprot:GHVT01022060.1.p2 GENE.GHVT01022060.1~~GHVT01022060.1.p2  ORF type:complete len:105 (-),score=9.07 GHVT01022060.1:478-792(-)
MGVSGGEEGARYGPAMMPGGDKEGYLMIADDLKRVAARVGSKLPLKPFASLRLLPFELLAGRSSHLPLSFRSCLQSHPSLALRKPQRLLCKRPCQIHFRKGYTS